MSRMIDADAFDEVLQNAQTECKKKGGNFRYGVLSNVRANLAKMPTVDAVPVVRCKDCKWCNDFRCQNDKVAYQIDDCGCHPTFYVNPDWFCPEAERKEEENEDGTTLVRYVDVKERER